MRDLHLRQLSCQAIGHHSAIGKARNVDAIPVNRELLLKAVNQLPDKTYIVHVGYKPIIGYTYPSTVMLYLDEIGPEEIRYWAYEICKEHKLCGFLMLRSSERNHHIIFNRAVSWAENMSIVASLCLKLKHESLTKWFLLQCIKREPTLRISIKGKKPPPRIVYRYGKQNGKIKEYLRYRKFGRLVKNR